jgi:hypothetical protein
MGRSQRKVWGIYSQAFNTGNNLEIFGRRKRFPHLTTVVGNENVFSYRPPRLQ